MMFVLDTNVISELRKGGRADSNVTRWFSLVDAGSFYLSVVTLMELEIGVLLVARRDPTAAEKLQNWIGNYVRPRFAHRMLSIDDAVALRCARLHIPNRQPDRDALIAATALVHGMTVVTRNVADFELTGVPIVNPWTA